MILVSIGGHADQGIRVDTESEPEIRLETAEGVKRLIGVVRGRYLKPGWSAVDESGQAETKDKKGEFEIWLPLKGVETSLAVRTVSPHGEVETSRFRVVVPDYHERMRGHSVLGSQFSVGLGVSSISFTETGLSTVTLKENGLTGKMGLLWPRVFGSDRWGASLSGFGTLLPFGADLSGVSVRFLGLNARAIYDIPRILKPWSVTLAAGFYYSTMLVSGTALGYQNVGGPQFYPSVSYGFENRDRIYGYAKFSPIANSLSLMSLSSREFATGAGWSHFGRMSHPLVFSFDYSNLALAIGAKSISCSTMTLSVGTTF